MRTCTRTSLPNQGYNAITRDPKFGLAFLKRWKHRLMFGTDSLHTRAIPFCSIVEKAPILDYLETAGLSAGTFAQITQHNAERVLPNVVGSNGPRLDVNVKSSATGGKN